MLSSEALALLPPTSVMRAGTLSTRTRAGASRNRLAPQREVARTTIFATSHPGLSAIFATSHPGLT